MSRFRKIKQQVHAILADPKWFERLAELQQWEAGNLVAPLFSLRLAPDEDVRWRTVVAFGRVAGWIADAGLEKARVLMRTFMWHMNEESGNLGWGIPESMAEAMINNASLAKEFSSILASYIYSDKECDGNYLDHPELRRGVFWGLGRLAPVYPEYVRPAERFLILALADEDAHNRALAAYALGTLGAAAAVESISPLLEDASSIRVFLENEVHETTVADMAKRALNALELAALQKN